MTTEVFRLTREIKILCVAATSFPDGVMGAFETLHRKIPSKENRTFYGISWMGKEGNILYKAGVTEIEHGEADKLRCEEFTIRQGEYLSVIIPDFMKNIPAMGESFRRLLADPRVDKKGYCVEIYFNDKDVRCMVTLDPLKN